MGKNDFSYSLWSNIYRIKVAYRQYQKMLVATFPFGMPLPLVHRQQQIEVLFAELDKLFLKDEAAYSVVCQSWDATSPMPDLLLQGEGVYRALQTEVSVLDSMQNEYGYILQTKLNEIRICFFYLQQHVCELINEAGLER